MDDAAVSEMLDDSSSLDRAEESDDDDTSASDSDFSADLNFGAVVASFPFALTAPLCEAFGLRLCLGSARTRAFAFAFALACASAALAASSRTAGASAALPELASSHGWRRPSVAVRSGTTS